MYHWHNFIQIEPHSEDAYLYEEKDLRLINLKAFVGGEGVGLPPSRSGTSLFP